MQDSDATPMAPLEPEAEGAVGLLGFDMLDIPLYTGLFSKPYTSPFIHPIENASITHGWKKVNHIFLPQRFLQKTLTFVRFFRKKNVLGVEVAEISDESKLE